MALIFEQPREYRFLTLIPPFICGICLAVFLPEPLKDFLHCFNYFGLVMFLVFGLFLAAKSFRKNISLFFYLITCGLIILIAFERTNAYITKPIQSDFLQKEIDFKVRVDLLYKRNLHQTKLITTLLSVASDGLTLHPNQPVLFTIKNDSCTQIAIGDTLIGRGFLNQIQNAKNPESFDARWFYKTKNILFKISRVKLPLIIHKNNEHSLSIAANKCQQYLLKVIHDHFPNEQTRGLMNALLIGDKIELNAQVKDAFTETGAAHILAVSGFHLGLIYLLLSKLLGSIAKGDRIKRTLKLSCYLFFIWGYVFITGNSPSVCRAASMLSIILVGFMLQRAPSIWNNIGLSAFVLLLFNPLFIFQVGFQLSYAAIIGIILFTNRLYRTVNFKNKIFKYTWAIVCMSIAAQPFVLPMSIYYFNQFPITFLISSIIAIPLATLIVMLGIAMLVIQLVSLPISKVIAQIIDFFIHKLIDCLSFLAQFQPDDLSNIYLSGQQAILILMSSCTILYYFQNKKKWKLGLIMLTFSMTGLSIGLSHANRKNYAGIIIYHGFNDPNLELFNDQKAYRFVKDTTSVYREFAVSGIHLKQKIKNTRPILFSEDFHEKQVLKRSGHLFIGHRQIVIVDQNTVIYPHLYKVSERLIIWLIDQRNEHFKLADIPPNALLVMDASIPPWISEKIYGALEGSNIQIHDIQKSGAFIEQFENEY